MECEFVVGTNASKDITVGTIGSMINLYNVPYTFRWILLGCGSAARTRNLIATRFLQAKEAPYLIFIDRDIVFTPQDIGKIFESLKNGYDLIAGCYTIKTTMSLASSCKQGDEPLLDGTIKEVRYLATGFMGITRNLLEKMIEGLKLPLMHGGGDQETYPFFEEKQHEDPDYGGMWLSEDYDFCHKARQVGVDSYLDTSIRLGHIGDALWQVDNTIESSHRRQISEKAQKAISKILQKEASAIVPAKQ